MKKWLAVVALFGSLLASGCENGQVTATEEQRVASSDWVEQQLKDVQQRTDDIEARAKRLEQQLSQLKVASGSSPVFRDVPLDHWAYVPVARLYEQGVVGGVGDRLFAPAQSITRAQAAAMLVRALRLPLSSKPSVFVDVPNSHPFAREVMTAYEAGLVGGYPNGQFAPQQSMKRKHMAMIIQRAFRLQAKPTPYAGYKDVGERTEGALEIRIISQHGIAEGNNGYFYPEEATTRAHFATFMYRALERK